MKKKYLFILLIALTFWGASFSVVQAEEFFIYKYHVVERGDNLWSIADEFYGEGNLWKHIYNSNNISMLKKNVPLIHRENILKIPILESQIPSTTPKGVTFHAYDYPPDLESFANYLDDEGGVAPIQQYRQLFIGPLHFENWKREGIMVGALPMGSYISSHGEEGKKIDYNIKACNKMSGPYITETSVYKKDRDDLISECYKSFDGEGYTFKLEKQYRVGTKRFFVVTNDEPGRLYEYVDQLIYSPFNNDLIYRAKRDGYWYIVEDGKEIGPYNYVHSSFYDSKGDLYALIRKEDGTSVILKNYLEYVSYDYIDEISYTKNADNFIYRAKDIEDDGSEFWFIVYGDKETQKWSYVDRYLNHQESGIVYYRARDKDGSWKIVKINPDGREEIAFEAKHGDQPISYYINPKNVNQILVELENENGDKYIGKNQDILNKTYKNRIFDIYFSPNGKHFVFIAKDDSNFYLLIDNKTSIDAGCKGTTFLCVRELRFDKDNNLVIYKKENDKIIRQVVKLD